MNTHLPQVVHTYQNHILDSTRWQTKEKHQNETVYGKAARMLKRVALVQEGRWTQGRQSHIENLIFTTGFFCLSKAGVHTAQGCHHTKAGSRQR